MLLKNKLICLTLVFQSSILMAANLEVSNDIKSAPSIDVTPVWGGVNDKNLRS